LVNSVNLFEAHNLFDPDIFGELEGHRSLSQNHGW